MKIIPDGANVCVKNDCKSVVDGVSQLLEYGRQNRLKNKIPRLFKNNASILDAIKCELDRLGHTRVAWVKGHSKDVMNRRADKLAVNTAKAQVACLLRTKMFNRKVYPHWKTYVSPINTILAKNRYTLKTGDSVQLTQHMCVLGHIMARKQCLAKNIPPDAIIFRAADELGIRRLTGA